MYEIQLGPVRYVKRGSNVPFSLVEAMREVRGVGQARILRLDGTVVVHNAGSDYAVTHVPSGTVVIRRPVRRRRTVAA